MQTHQLQHLQGGSGTLFVLPSEVWLLVLGHLRKAELLRFGLYGSMTCSSYHNASTASAKPFMTFPTMRGATVLLMPSRAYHPFVYQLVAPPVFVRQSYAFPWQGLASLQAMLISKIPHLWLGLGRRLARAGGTRAWSSAAVFCRYLCNHLCCRLVCTPSPISLMCDIIFCLCLTLFCTNCSLVAKSSFAFRPAAKALETGPLPREVLARPRVACLHSNL
jgi:hypothetical protein